MPSRVLVLASACFQEHGRQPSLPRDDRVSWGCASDDQPYPRTIKVGPAWQRLDLGWLAGDGEGRAGLIYLTNEEGKRWDRNPTKEERARVEGRVVEVGVALADGTLKTFGLLTPLRAPLLLAPADPGNVWLRCPSLAGEQPPEGGKPSKAVVVLTAYPA